MKTKMKMNGDQHENVERDVIGSLMTRSKSNKDEMNKVRELILSAGKLTPELKFRGTEDNPIPIIRNTGDSVMVSARALIDTASSGFEQIAGSNDFSASDVAFNLPVTNWMSLAGIELSFIDNRYADGVKLPLTDSITINWVAENAAPASDASPTLSSTRELFFRQISAYIDVSRRVMKGRLLNVSDYLMTEMSRAFYASIADKLLVGVTSSEEIEGIINTTGVNTQNAATSGEQVAITNALKAIANSEGSPNLIIANANTRAVLQNMLWEAAGTATTGFRPLWELNSQSRSGETCMGMTAAISNALADGTVIMGDFRSIRAFAYRDVEFMAHTVGKATVDGSTRIVAHMFMDSLIRPEHFSVITGVA